eukprot:CAMPEP_0178679842 /NCGR_PEP_ID=MMETSP0699-20121125/399_1 /TAXON_ID=265572 /ORGANISM="Extubocellulus spinifer, Strain CCMP396" /LENGTH=375 /DNA_ID=CAMNT_0020324223 /DNA_START=532 /DNA_END=1660 /DNA_ORIENTATION=+
MLRIFHDRYNEKHACLLKKKNSSKEKDKKKRADFYDPRVFFPFLPPRPDYYAVYAEWLEEERRLDIFGEMEESDTETDYSPYPKLEPAEQEQWNRNEDRRLFFKNWTEEESGEKSDESVGLQHSNLSADLFVTSMVIEGTEKRKVAADIFQCDKVFFPLNIGNWHWIFYEVEIDTLTQKLYDSMSYPIDSDRKQTAARLHNWLQHIHKKLHGTDLMVLGEKGLKVPCRRHFDTKRMLITGSQKLGNSMQGCNDCLLHTAVVPVLIADRREIGVFGETEEEQELAGIEMRRRMCLTLKKRELWFQSPPQKGDGGSHGESGERNDSMGFFSPTDIVVKKENQDEEVIVVDDSSSTGDESEKKKKKKKKKWLNTAMKR